MNLLFLNSFGHNSVLILQVALLTLSLDFYPLIGLILVLTFFEPFNRLIITVHFYLCVFRTDLGSDGNVVKELNIHQWNHEQKIKYRYNNAWINNRHPASIRAFQCTFTIIEMSISILHLNGLFLGATFIFLTITTAYRLLYIPHTK